MKAFCHVILFGETFAIETFANFGLFRESLSREILLIFQFVKVYPVNSEVFSHTNFCQFFSILKTPYFP